MYNKPHYTNSLIILHNQKEGETIEQKVMRIIENKEPIKDGSPIIYTERSKGVDPAHNIRTDRFELATEAMDKVHKSKQAKRDELIKKDKEAKIINLNKDKDSGAEPIPGKATK